jgi:hypothetical protein
VTQVAAPPRRRSARWDLPVVAVLAVDGALLGAFGVVYTPLYAGAVPVPMGAVLTALILPWLVLEAGALRPRPLVAAAPLLAWLLAVATLGVVAPGGDVLLAPTWQTLLLIAAGLGAGLWAVRQAEENGGGPGVGER